ncbi:TlpA disulfide reductase family protein [Sphingosinicella microcystinivorans]|uniref:TlpA disulfide reductase family protein n=1 Tax=Sphingosinicella microcystinivorans TaxID=335406 RepID=UPI0022F3A4F3|nr:TlpA disulfide reductase family protein [Sphingosinicella microcystinivorans]WBX84606.1 TlpA disulfide reductase family protein [Sphingosinicella microcystinivorans]
MNPNDIIQIGPLAMALDRLVAIALILTFLAGMDWIVRRFAIAGWQPAGLALLAGLVGARAAYVWVHRESFALDPVVSLQAWLGGWVWSAGVATAALVVVVIMRRLRPIAAGLGLLAALSSVWWAFAEGQAPRSAILLPTGLRFDMARGGSITAGDLRGRPAVLNLWASWCPPCRREMPMLINAAANERRAAVLLVNQGETPAQLRAFLQSQGLPPRDVALDQEGMLSTFTGSPALPTTLFVAADGTIRQTHVGEISRVQLDIAIRALTKADRPRR